MGILRKIINVKFLLIIVVIVLTGYLCSRFPDESILIGGIAIIIVIGIWMMQLTKDELQN